MSKILTDKQEKLNQIYKMIIEITNEDRNKLINYLVDNRVLTYEQIGKVYNVSRQAVHQWVNEDTLVEKASTLGTSVENFQEINNGRPF